MLRRRAINALFSLFHQRANRFCYVFQWKFTNSGLRVLHYYSKGVLVWGFRKYLWNIFSSAGFIYAYWRTDILCHAAWCQSHCVGCMVALCLYSSLQHGSFIYIMECFFIRGSIFRLMECVSICFSFEKAGPITDYAFFCYLIFLAFFIFHIRRANIRSCDRLARSFNLF